MKDSTLASRGSELTGGRQTATPGELLHRFASELYPICRSITGNGVRDTLRRIGERIPLQLHEVPSSARLFDWEVPLEWNIEDAWVLDPQGRKVIDFRAHNLHIVNYSEPVDMRLPLEELRPRLHSLPQHPHWIPYRTSYFRRNWGFCLTHEQLERLEPGKYQVRIASSLTKGGMTYAECVVQGRTRHEVLLFTHTCHPSLANDNTSGMSVATWLAAWLAESPRRYTYRLVFAAGTLGTLGWLKRNEARLNRVRHGLVVCLLGDAAPFTYKLSRRGTFDIDRVVPYVLARSEPTGATIPFEPYGYHERQLCSPGFDLPVGRLTRSVNDGYPEYHSSADDLGLVTPNALAQSLEVCKQIVDVLEHDRRYVNLSPKGEPRLGKRGLYGSTGGRSPADRERTMLWVLNQSDGEHGLLDIAQRSGIEFASVSAAAEELRNAKLLRDVQAHAPATKSGRKRPATRAGVQPARRTTSKRVLR